jgi:hypothetical protein
MLLVILALLCLASVPATGGDLRSVGTVRVRLAPLAATALAVQILITQVWTSGSHSLHGALQLASYVLGGIFTAANISIPGIATMALGGALNLTAIAANAGVMPASRWAVARSGLTVGHGFANSAPVAHPHLLWLGDIIPVPAGPLANVLSVGDLLIFTGLLFLLQRSCGRHARHTGSPQRAQRSPCTSRVGPRPRQAPVDHAQQPSDSPDTPDRGPTVATATDEAIAHTPTGQECVPRARRANHLAR